MKLLKTLLTVLITTPELVAGSPSIDFTYVPPTGSYANLTGTVSGVSPSTYGVALFINVFGTYWTKPYLNQPITALAADGTFSADITTGGTSSLDAYAEQVLGYVVPLSYTTIPTLSGATSIPQEILNNSVASAVANKFTPISFTNYWWEVKETGNGEWGPGPENYFSGNNVNVDSQGRLHLTISYSDGEWRCAEVILTNSFGYGTYRIWLDNDLSTLPTNIVFGFFTWNNYPSYNYRESDVEFSNGAVVGSPTNWQYVVQPYYDTGNRTNFSEPSSGMSTSTHTLTWAPGAVYFESYTNQVTDQRTFNILSSTNLTGWTPVGQTNVVPDSTTALTITGSMQRSQFCRAEMASFAGTPSPFKAAWLTNGVPPAGDEQIHLNLWLYNGAAPGSSTTNTYEVIISKFEFIPLASIEPQVAITQVATNGTKLLLKYRTN
jgi:hypothetical protein